MNKKVQANDSLDEHGCYFTDNKKRADYVLVVNETTDILKAYIASLEKYGLELEMHRTPGLDIFFIIIHIPESDLKDYAKIFDIGMEIPTVQYVPKGACLRWMEAKVNVPVKKMGQFTSCERIMIIQKLLERAKFGADDAENGLGKLLRQHVLEDAYPLHDGLATHPTDTARQNDRRLLYLHWARFRCWYKEVPLDLVHRYFGCEIAFYFAWVEFFTLMLLPASIIGLLIVVYNFVIVNTTDVTVINQVCDEREILICPTCSFKKYCSYKNLSRFCFAVKGEYMFDNYLTVFFAVFMSFWATLFLNLWKRKQNNLKMRWGVEYVDSDEAEVRHEYIDELRRRKLYKRPSGLEPFLPKYVTCSHIVAAISICMFMILLVLLAVIGVTIFKIIVQAESSISGIEFFKANAKTVATITGSILQVLFIKLFGTMYGDLSIWLTSYENPRTKRDFDNSVLYKRYFLSFVNNYAALFYIAFLKGRFYKLPYRDDILRLLETDSCQPINCILALCIQLAFLMVLKKFVGNILTLIIINLKTTARKLRKVKSSDIPIYEADYALLPTNRYLLTTEFCEMIIEFGFVTFFVAAFPLAPLCAFLNNLLEHRLDATKLVTKYRRPVPRNMAGIGAWDGVMLGVTYLSTATNAFVIAFTSDFVWKELYRTRHNPDLDGYVKSSLSSYATKDFDFFKGIPPNPEICYYSDKRYPPDHPEKYDLTFDYWVDLAFRLICVFVFEHVLLLLNGVLSYAIPDLPKSVKEHLNMDRQLAKRAKLKVISKTIRKAEKREEMHDVSSWIMV